jgi:hypothetical protein
MGKTLGIKGYFSASCTLDATHSNVKTIFKSFVINGLQEFMNLYPCALCTIRCEIGTGPFVTPPLSLMIVVVPE